MPFGLFISLDGLDGAGKSTQCRLLADWLREEGESVTECRDPGGTELGMELRNLLLNYRGNMSPSCEALLFMASRAQLVSEVIHSALEAGQVVVSDRFVLANVVYQGHAGGLDPEELWKLGRFSANGIEPDLTFVLDLPLEIAVARRKGAADRLEARAADYQRRVRDGFLEEARRRSERIQIVDATRPMEEIQQSLRQAVRPLLLRPRAERPAGHSVAPTE
jgi:dTMP kinase